jgi:hypothetical protein
MDASEYKHVVLGLIFLKYISDAFEEQHARLDAERDQGADPEDPDEYRALNIFWVPPEARWSHLKAQARQATIGQLVDDAMAAIERDNATLKSVLPKDYARPALDKQRLGQLIDMISNIQVGESLPSAERLWWVSKCPGDRPISAATLLPPPCSDEGRTRRRSRLLHVPGRLLRQAEDSQAVRARFLPSCASHEPSRAQCRASFPAYAYAKPAR